MNNIEMYNASNVPITPRPILRTSGTNFYTSNKGSFWPVFCFLLSICLLLFCLIISLGGMTGQNHNMCLGKMPSLPDLGITKVSEYQGMLVFFYVGILVATVITMWKWSLAYPGIAFAIPLTINIAFLFKQAHMLTWYTNHDLIHEGVSNDVSNTMQALEKKEFPSEVFVMRCLNGCSTAQQCTREAMSLVWSETTSTLLTSYLLMVVGISCLVMTIAYIRDKARRSKEKCLIKKVSFV